MKATTTWCCESDSRRISDSLEYYLMLKRLLSPSETHLVLARPPLNYKGGPCSQFSLSCGKSRIVLVCNRGNFGPWVEFQSAENLMITFNFQGKLILWRISKECLELWCFAATNGRVNAKSPNCGHFRRVDVQSRFGCEHRIRSEYLTECWQWTRVVVISIQEGKARMLECMLHLTQFGTKTRLAQCLGRIC